MCLRAREATSTQDDSGAVMIDMDRYRRRAPIKFLRRRYHASVCTIATGLWLPLEYGVRIFSSPRIRTNNRRMWTRFEVQQQTKLRRRRIRLLERHGDVLTMSAPVDEPERV